MLLLAKRNIAGNYMRTKEFFCICDLPPATGHRMLATLEANGLIARGSEFLDGRCQSVSLTPECIGKIAELLTLWANEMQANPVDK